MSTARLQELVTTRSMGLILTYQFLHRTFNTLRETPEPSVESILEVALQDYFENNVTDFLSEIGASDCDFELKLDTTEYPNQMTKFPIVRTKIMIEADFELQETDESIEEQRAATELALESLKGYLKLWASALATQLMDWLELDNIWLYIDVNTIFTGLRQYYPVVQPFSVVANGRETPDLSQLIETSAPPEDIAEQERINTSIQGYFLGTIEAKLEEHLAEKGLNQQSATLPDSFIYPMLFDAVCLVLRLAYDFEGSFTHELSYKTQDKVVYFADIDSVLKYWDQHPEDAYDMVGPLKIKFYPMKSRQAGGSELTRYMIDSDKFTRLAFTLFDEILQVEFSMNMPPETSTEKAIELRGNTQCLENRSLCMEH